MEILWINQTIKDYSLRRTAFDTVMTSQIMTKANFEWSLPHLTACWGRDRVHLAGPWWGPSLHLAVKWHWPSQPLKELNLTNNNIDKWIGWIGAWLLSARRKGVPNCWIHCGSSLTEPLALRPPVYRPAQATMWAGCGQGQPRATVNCRPGPAHGGRTLWGVSVECCSLLGPQQCSWGMSGKRSRSEIPSAPVGLVLFSGHTACDLILPRDFVVGFAVLAVMKRDVPCQDRKS